MCKDDKTNRLKGCKMSDIIISSERFYCKHCNQTFSKQDVEFLFLEAQKLLTKIEK